MQPSETTTTSPKPFVFVLMPFDSSFDDTYQLGIRDACKKAGAFCQRVDEQYIDGSILDRVYNQIAKADIIVADMTGQNPNVFFEVGYAYALNKRVVLLTKKADDIPFDLKHYQHIVYDKGIVFLKAELTKRIKWMVDNPTDRIVQVQNQLQFYYKGTLLDGSPELKYPYFEDSGISRLYIPIDMHNSITTTIEKASFQVGFVTSIEHRDDHLDDDDSLHVDTFRQPDERYLHVIRKKFNLSPGAWDKCAFTLESVVPQSIDYGSKVNIVLRVFTDTGPVDFPFTLVPVKESLRFLRQKMVSDLSQEEP